MTTPRSAPARAAAGLAFALTLPIYLATMNRSIGFMDRGELAAVASTWGIPHATGYPTLMLLAGAVVHLAPVRPVLALNALAAVLVALGAAILVALFDRVLATATPAFATRPRAALALFTALTVALTTTWWQQANGFEVYPLHCVFMPLVVLLGLVWTDAVRAESQSAARPSSSHRKGFAFALVTGLSLTNHMTTVLLAPGLVALALLRFGPRSFAARVPRLALPFLLGLLPYAWLPIRSAMHPRFDWGSPHTLRAFLHHVSGADYRRLMFAGAASSAEQARFLTWRAASDFAWLGPAAAALGALLLARRAASLAVLAGLVAAAGAVFAVNYRIPDLDSYLLTTVLGLGILVAAGLLRILERFGARAAIACGIGLVLANGALHWRDCDESGNRLPEAFVHDLIGPLPPNALLFTALWGQGVSPAWYFQSIEHFRPDVTVVCLDLTRVSWYLDALERERPELVRRAAPELARYRGMLRDAELGRPYNGRTIEAVRHEFLNALATGAMRDRAVLTTAGLPEPKRGGSRVPYGLALWLRPDTAYVREPAWRYAFRPWSSRIDGDVAETCRLYAESRVERAKYEQVHGRPAAVLPLLAGAARFDPLIRPERIGPMPLEVDRTVLEAAAYFRELQRTLEAASQPLAAGSDR